MTPRRHGPGAQPGPCWAPRGTGQFLHLLNGGSVSCCARRERGLPNPWDKAGLSSPKALLSDPAERARPVLGPHQTGAGERQGLTPQVLPTHGCSTSALLQTLAPGSARQAHWLPPSTQRQLGAWDACPRLGTPVTSSDTCPAALPNKRVGAKYKTSRTKKNQKGLQTVYSRWKSTGRAPKHPC